MIPRALHATILGSLERFPVVGLIGARQVGKTSLAKSIASQLEGKVQYLDLELPSDLAKLESPELYLRQHFSRLVILDEIQRKPELFPVLRALVDQDSRRGRFLILGSASPDLLRQSSESLAGRIIYHELGPFSLTEVSDASEAVTKLWCQGGYPRSFLAATDDESMQWRAAFVRTHLERDIPNLGYQTSAAALQRFWQMLAHCHGQLWNASKIAGSLGVEYKTVQRYLDILRGTFMVRALQPYHPNVKKRLVKAPKVYLRDSGLLHALLGIRNRNELLGHPIAGASWEGWAIEQVLAALPAQCRPFFYRTHAGAEIDLIVQVSAGRPLIALEMKYSLAPAPAKGFWTALGDLGPCRGFVAYPGDDYYPLGEHVFALPVTELSRLNDL